jgi:hypothetical protein
MNERKRQGAKRRLLVIGAAAMLAFAPPAHAYMDPGSMSVIVTAVLGALAAVGYTARLYWARFKGFISRVLGRRNPEDSPRNRE